MLLDERDENLVRQRARLSKFGVRAMTIFFSATPLLSSIFSVWVDARLASWQNKAPATRSSVFSM
jgi:hypothetical protein